ncbi:MAG: 6-carboxytetrahydropterin synthase, partial [Candidatus Hydrogenedentota bacterium]
MPKLDLIKTFQFEAAHRSAHGSDPDRLHGHSYQIDLVVEGELDPTLGWVIDYADISEAFAPIYDQLDHRTLNDIEGLTDTTLPSLHTWIVEHTKRLIPLLKDINLTILGECAFGETILSSTDVNDVGDRVRFGFEASHALPKLPPDHK